MNLKALYSIFRNHSEGAYIMEFPNCVALYKFCKEHDVTKVLDLGTGIGASSAFVALALNEKGVDYKIDSLEQFDKCVRLAKELIPVDLQKNLNIIRTNVAIWQAPQAPSVNYSIFDSIPEGDYDLIINDGPSFWRENDYLVDLPNGTVSKMLLEGRLKPDTFVVWDGRISMLSQLERHFSPNFELYRAAKPNQDDMNILRRLDTPPTFLDEKLKAMREKTTFFNEEIISTIDSTPAFSEATASNTGTGQEV